MSKLAIQPTPLQSPSPLYYEEAGAGRPVVLLHGMGCDCRTWDLVRPHLAAGRRVLTPDLPGHGRSPKPRGTYSLSLYVDHLARWLDALGTGPVDLIGHSLGGALATALTVARPDLVRSLGAVSSVRLTNHTPPKPVLRAFMTFGLSQLFGGPSLRATRRFLERGFGVPADVTPELVALFRDAAAVSTRAVISTSRTLRWPESVLFDLLDQVRCPAWLLWGERDPLYPGRDQVNRVAGRFPQASVTLMDCGHLPMFEQPEVFQEHLQAHLDRC